MKLLLDQNISYQITKKIAEYFPESTQAGRLGMSQTSDSMLWQYARINDYAIVTYDSYFSNRTFLVGEPFPKVIKLKCKNTSTDHVAGLLIKHQKKIIQFLEEENYSCLELEG